MKAAKLAHPDKGGSAERFHQVQVAYNLLNTSTYR